MTPAYWLVKQEPAAYSWERFAAEGGTAWTGIRNFQARNHLRSMQRGDLVLFYHSVSAKKVVGIARVTRSAYSDPTAKEGDWSAIDLQPVRSLKQPVGLDVLKSDPVLSELPLIRQSRLSVMPLTPVQFERILALGTTPLTRPS
jgi:predicted RNA-binding protein with PUA-like domain